MPIITRLAAGKRDPSRVNVYIDGKFVFSLSADQVLRRSLHQDTELSDQEVQDLHSLSAEEKLFTKILNYLSYRPRSRREVKLRLTTYLKDHDNPQPVTDSMLARLDKLGYLDDLAFASWFVDSRASARPRSLRHLRSELFSKGLSREIIDKALSDYNEEIALQHLVAKKRGMDPTKLKSYLARLGFPYDLIRSTIDANHNLE
jgi:regulatory protein